MEAAGAGCACGFDNSPTPSVASTPRNIPGLLAAKLAVKQMFGGARRNSVQLLLSDAFPGLRAIDPVAELTREEGLRSACALRRDGEVPGVRAVSKECGPREVT
jgi:hypothetical protein